MPLAAIKTMKSIADEFFALTPEQRRTVQFALCEHALQKWHQYVSARTRIEYTESVVGTHHIVDQQLPVDALESAKRSVDVGQVGKRYREPITALQDDDLVFPQNITFAYYALYNLFKKYGQGESVDDWLIVNQAISSEEDDPAWEVLLTNAIRTVV